ncbi:MAG TPA: hypothetical protein PLA50_11345, partial [Bacteroidia bacterium]|nr:hypothetical protein [Bacteroidia bacterium]
PAMIAIGIACAVLPLSAAHAENPLLPGAEALIDAAVAKSAPPLAAAIDLANRDAKSDKNLLIFLKALKDYGFGTPTARPPWADEHEDPDAPKKEL